MCQRKWLIDCLLSLIFAGAFAAFMVFIPETLPRLVIARAAKKDLNQVDELDVEVRPQRVNVLKEMRFVTTMTFRIMLTEPIVTFLGTLQGNRGAISFTCSQLLPPFRSLQWFCLWA